MNEGKASFLCTERWPLLLLGGCHNWVSFSGLWPSKVIWPLNSLVLKGANGFLWRSCRWGITAIFGCNAFSWSTNSVLAAFSWLFQFSRPDTAKSGLAPRYVLVSSKMVKPGPAGFLVSVFNGSLATLLGDLVGDPDREGDLEGDVDRRESVGDSWNDCLCKRRT